jgi:hypothetical protein
LRSRFFIAPEGGSESDWIVHFATRQGRRRTRTYLNHVLAESLIAEATSVDAEGRPIDRSVRVPQYSTDGTHRPRGLA